MKWKSFALPCLKKISFICLAMAALMATCFSFLSIYSSYYINSSLFSNLKFSFLNMLIWDSAVSLIYISPFSFIFKSFWKQSPAICSYIFSYSFKLLLTKSFSMCYLFKKKNIEKSCYCFGFENGNSAIYWKNSSTLAF